MHLAYVCPRYPPGTSVSGVSTYTALMADEMAARGHAVSVFCLEGVDDASARACRQEGVPVTHAAQSRSFRVPLLRALYYRAGHWLRPAHFQIRDVGAGLREAVRRVLATEHIDLIECPDARGLASWVYPLRLPTVVRLHAPGSVTALGNGDRLDRNYRALARAERGCLMQARFISAPTHAVVEATQKVLGLSLPEAFVIPNPFPAGRLASGQPGEMPGRPREILFVGRMDRLKGFDVAVRAFSQLAAGPDGGDLRLKVVGPDSGLLIDGTNRVSGPDFVRRTVRDSAVISRIEMLGRLPFDEVQELRRSGSITIVPSAFENFSGAIVEAMAAGCPVVASRAGGSPEIIDHERSGLLFTPGDPSDLARQIRRLLDDPGLCQRLGAQGRADVYERYHPGRVADRMEEYYRKVLETSRPGGRR